MSEKDGKLIVKGTAEYQYDKDLLWDAIKKHSDWESDLVGKVSPCLGRLPNEISIGR